MHANARHLFDTYASHYFNRDSRVLEVGADVTEPVVAPHKVWDTTDMYRKAGQTFLSQEYHINAPDNSYDIVLSINVLEHVRQPWVWMKDLVRVCRPDGAVITIVPANWPYHEDPIDCWRVYPDGMKAVMEFVGLEVVQCVALYGELVGDEVEFWKCPDALTVDTLGIGRKP